MKKEREIDLFVEGMEMTILSTEEQVLLESGGWICSGSGCGDGCNTYCPADGGGPFVNHSCR